MLSCLQGLNDWVLSYHAQKQILTNAHMLAAVGTFVSTAAAAQQQLEPPPLEELLQLLTV